VRILVTGITGAVGSRLAPRLLADGHHVRGLSRRADARVPSEIELARGDAVSGAGLERALAGIDVAYYLIHSMESQAGTAFAEQEHAAAEHFAFAARLAGVRRTVYLGGPVPLDHAPSSHLASRMAVEQLLLAGTPEAVAFRASIMIDSSSRSFRFLVHLVERMPVLVLPAWRTHRTAPIDGRDMIEFLARAATAEGIAGRSLDMPGPEIVSYQGLIERIRDHMLVSRPILAIPRLTATPITSRVSSIIAGEDPAFIGPMMDSLDADLLPRDDQAATLLGVRRHSLDSAIEHALCDWEASESLRAR
jgi:uncharacterized protein YbjT (DUF2867 family)